MVTCAIALGRPLKLPVRSRLWGAEMRSVMKHAYKCGAIRRVLVLRRRFVAFPEARLQLALKGKALAGQWNDGDDNDYSRLHNWR
jgi:hypothetical protein